MEVDDKKWKDAIVFISSTFNDMHAERDYLVKEVFPELTEWCEMRKIRLTDIDLRWGVSEEDSSNNKTIETCLRHVDKSRPFFLCFLGQRRGWVPNYDKDISDKTKELYDFDGLKERYKDKGDRSATEMEIEHALLKPLEILLNEGDNPNYPQPPTMRHSIFFFRNGDYVNQLSNKAQRLIYTNEYLKEIAVSKVMEKLKDKDSSLYNSILKTLKEDYELGSKEYPPQFISELIYDFQDVDCIFYNDLISNLVKNPISNNNLDIIAELKFKNKVIYKEITHEIKNNDEMLYANLISQLNNYKYKNVGIDQFSEKFDYGEINDIINQLQEDNNEEFEIHERELKNLRSTIEKKCEVESEKEGLDEKDKVHIIIKDYEGTWDNTKRLTELSHYRFGEGDGKLTNFKCEDKPLKEIIIKQFKEQFELEFYKHIKEIYENNPELYKESEIIKIDHYETKESKDKKLINELDQQENFCYINSEGFVPRSEYTDKLKEYVESSDDKICLVSAEAGLGKTMLLADFATNFSTDFPNKKLYKRFCGGSDLSSKTYSLWKTIVDEAGIDENEKCYPHNLIDLRRNIDDILKEIAKEDDVVIIIDAINQMENGMEMLNWFGLLPDNLKLIVSVKEVSIDKVSDKSKEDIESDREYQEQLENIKKKNSISKDNSFKLKGLDYRKEVSIKKYVENIAEYVESKDNNVCLVNSDLNYDKSLIFNIFNDKYSDKDIINFNCILKNSDCPTDKIKKSIREFGNKKSVCDVIEITGKAEAIKTKLESHLNDISSDSIIIIDVMSNDNELLEEISNINYNSKTIIGIKGDYSFNNQSNHSFNLKELDVEKNGIIKAYLSNYLKELDEKEIHDICNFDGSRNPLFLKILLSELRVFGSFDQLKDEIKSFGDSPSTAFNHVFERLEADEKERDEGDKAIVEPLFSLLASSRAGGLSEEEIVTIIKDKYDLDEDYVTANVNLNLRQVRPFMARKEGRHDFFYEKFRESAEERYISEFVKVEDDKKELKRRFGKNYDENIGLLRDYFKNKADLNKVRRYMELPYYLNESGPEYVGELEDTLSSYSFIKNKICLSKDVYSLILDYDYLNFEKDEDGPLELIQRALELSSPVLMNNPEKLPEQLWGRMNEIKGDSDNDENKYEKIEKLLDDLVNDTTKKWLKPTSSVLYSPKSSIIKRLLPDGNGSSSCIEFTNDDKILFGSSDGVLSLYDLKANSHEVLERMDSKIVKFILKEDNSFYVARANGEIKKWNLFTRDVEDFPKIDVEGEDGDLKDIYVSDTYNKIYAASHEGVYSIDLDTNEKRKEDIEAKNYNQILVPRRNEAILVCDEREVDGWDVYEMRKAYNKHHQQNDDDESSTKLDSSEEIRFMGLNKRFLTLISENGQMKFWNTLKNSGGGESIDEAQVCSPNDKFTQAKTLEDENQIITISDMGVLRVWNIPQPRQPKFEIAKNDKTDIEMDIQTGIKSPTAIGYRRDAEDMWVIVGNENNDVSIIDLNKKVEVNTNKRHAESVLSIKIDDNHMITASDNGEIYTWNLDNEQFINKFSNDFRCNSVSYNREDKKLVFAGVKAEKDGRKTYKVATCDISEDMWEAKSGEDNEAIPLDVDETINSKEIIELTQNDSGIVFIEENKLVIGSNETKLDNVATTLATKFDSNNVFVGFKDGSIVRYPDGVVFDKPVDSAVTKIKISDEGKLIAGYGDGSIKIFGLDGTLEDVKGLKHEKAITNIHVIRNSEIATVSEDNTLKFWDIKDAKCTYTYYLDIYATAINVSGDKLVVGDALGNVRFFKLDN